MRKLAAVLPLVVSLLFVSPSFAGIETRIGQDLNLPQHFENWVQKHYYCDPEDNGNGLDVHIFAKADKGADSLKIEAVLIFLRSRPFLSTDIVLKDIVLIVHGKGSKASEKEDFVRLYSRTADSWLELGAVDPDRLTKKEQAVFEARTVRAFMEVWPQLHSWPTVTIESIDKYMVKACGRSLVERTEALFNALLKGPLVSEEPVSLPEVGQAQPEGIGARMPAAPAK